MKPGVSVTPLCYCGLDRGECVDCNRGYRQEIAAGRLPNLKPPAEPLQSFLQ